MVFIAAITRSSSTTSRAVVQRLISTSAARPAVTSKSSASRQADTRKIVFVGSTILFAYAMKPTTTLSASCDDARIPMEHPKTQQPSVAPFKQLFGPDQRISSFQRDVVGVPLRLTFVEGLALTNTKGIHHVGSF